MVAADDNETCSWDPKTEKLIGELLWQKVYEEMELLALWHVDQRKIIMRLRLKKELDWSEHALEDKITGMILYQLDLNKVGSLMRDRGLLRRAVQEALEVLDEMMPTKEQMLRQEQLKKIKDMLRTSIADAASEEYSDNIIDSVGETLLTCFEPHYIGQIMRNQIAFHACTQVAVHQVKSKITQRKTSNLRRSNSMNFVPPTSSKCPRDTFEFITNNFDDISKPIDDDDNNSNTIATTDQEKVTPPSSPPSIPSPPASSSDLLPLPRKSRKKTSRSPSPSSTPSATPAPKPNPSQPKKPAEKSSSSSTTTTSNPPIVVTPPNAVIVLPTFTTETATTTAVTITSPSSSPTLTSSTTTTINNNNVNNPITNADTYLNKLAALDMLLLARKMKRNSLFSLPAPTDLLVYKRIIAVSPPLKDTELLEKKYETLVKQMAECVVYHYLNKRQINSGGSFEWVSNTRNMMSPRSSNCADDKGYNFWFSESVRGTGRQSTVTTYYLAVKGHITDNVNHFTLNEDEWEVAATCKEGGSTRYIVVGVQLYPQPAKLLYWIENPLTLLKSSPVRFQQQT